MVSNNFAMCVYVFSANLIKFKTKCFYIKTLLKNGSGLLFVHLTHEFVYIFVPDVQRWFIVKLVNNVCYFVFLNKKLKLFSPHLSVTGRVFDVSW